jgi:hypothetical protein
LNLAERRAHSTVLLQSVLASDAVLFQTQSNVGKSSVLQFEYYGLLWITMDYYGLLWITTVVYYYYHCNVRVYALY